MKNNHAGEPFNAQVREQIERARSQFAPLDEQLRALVNERPVLVLLAAVGAGYVLARVASRA